MFRFGFSMGGCRCSTIPNFVNNSEAVLSKDRSSFSGCGQVVDGDASRNENASRNAFPLVIILFSKWQGMILRIGH